MATPFPENITIDDFKVYFSMYRAFSLNTYAKHDLLTTFTLNQKVYNGLTFDIYKSLIDPNLGNELTNAAAWVLDSTEDNIVFDEMITQAFELATERLATELKIRQHKQAYLLLTAHYLQLILNTRIGNAGFGVENGGTITSASSISTSVGKALLPNFNLTLAEITSTTFGAEYQAIIERLIPKITIINRDELYSYSDY